jgi:predicted phage-related endonuclease
MEYIDKMQKASPFLNRQKFVNVEIKFTKVDGKQEIIAFDLFELENIEILAQIKKQIFKMQGTKKEIINKIRDLKDEVDMLENMETV